MDADGTHKPKYITNLLKHIKKFDLVSTNRFLKKKSCWKGKNINQGVQINANGRNSRVMEII